ncbi:zinc finger protein ZFP2-like [Dysidea avara]|uniref:zinc finger protein ZFP2-like n=1 Tax=Dysidea avara TaxID=196820 RepID=UPI003330783A
MDNAGITDEVLVLPLNSLNQTKSTTSLALPSQGSSFSAALKCDKPNEEAIVTDSDNIPDEIPEGTWFKIIKPEPEEFEREFVPEGENIAVTTDIPSEAQSQGQLQRQYYSCQVYQVAPLSAVYVRTKSREILDQQSDCQEIVTTTGHNMTHNTEEDEHNVHLQREYPFQNATELHQCEICQLVFTTRAILEYHMRRHKKIYQCNICQREFLAHSYLVNHLKTHSSKQYQCEVCQRQFRTYSGLTNHILIHSKQEPLQKCGICQQEFTTALGLKIHIGSHSEQQMTGGDLKSHTEQSHSKEQESCDISQKEFSSSSTLMITSHTWSHRIDRFGTGELYKCAVCQGEFTSKLGLSNHMRVHSKKEAKYKCEICQKAYVSTSGLTTHMRTHGSNDHPEVEQQTELFKCGICNKKYTTLAYLTDHMKFHYAQNSQLYQCEVCKRRFRDSNYLKLHMDSHTKEKPYQCDVCQKCFAENAYLKRHKMIHSGKKPYECNICQKRFLRLSGLNDHTKSHSKEMPFQCHLCGKRLTTKRHLDGHMLRVHIAKGESLDNASSIKDSVGCAPE